MLEMIHRMLAITLGRPPREFVWQWRDKDDEFHRDGTITPHEFYERYVGFDLDAFVSLINCPTPDKPFARLYTVQYLGNVEGGEPVRYLNVDIETFKRAAVEQLKEGAPVWFGCDVGKMMERDLGILDRELYDYGLVFGTEFTADKAERVEYGHSVMTHAMVLTGVDLDDGEQATQVEGRELLGREARRQGLLRHERPLVRRVHVRGRRREEVPAGGAADRSWRRSPSCCRPGTRWGRWPWRSKALTPRLPLPMPGRGGAELLSPLPGMERGAAAAAEGWGAASGAGEGCRGSGGVRGIWHN